MDEASQGLAVGWPGAVWDPLQQWQRAGSRHDRRLDPGSFGGRLMRHPALDSIIYARIPDETIGFAEYPIKRVRSVVTPTIGGSVVTRFMDNPWDVVIEEKWNADDRTASTVHEMYNLFYAYLTTPLPPGLHIGWQPGDRSWRRFQIEMLDVQLGTSPESPSYNEASQDRPYLLAQPLTVRFKLAFDAIGGSGAMVGVGD